MADELDGKGDGGVTGKQGGEQGEKPSAPTLDPAPVAAPVDAGANAGPDAGGNAGPNAGPSPAPNVARAREDVLFKKGHPAWNKGQRKPKDPAPSSVPSSASSSASTQAPANPNAGGAGPAPVQSPVQLQVVSQPAPEQPRSESEVEIDEAAELEKPEGAYEMPEFRQGARLAPPLPRELSMLARALKLYVPDKDIKEAVWDYFSNVPAGELNQYTLYNALSAHRVKDATNNWIVRYVFPPNAVQNPYAPPPGMGDGNPYPNPNANPVYATARQTMMEEDPVAKLEREAAMEDARAKAALSRMERAAYVAKISGPPPSQGDGGVSTPEILQMVQTIMAMKNEGSSPAEILDVALKLTQATRPPDNGGQQGLTAFQLEMQKIQNEERARTHEREIALLQSKADADKAAALAGAAAQNPSNSVDAAMAMLGKFQSAGLAASPASPQIQKEMRELDLRYGLAQMKAEEERQRRADEAAFRRQKEQQDQATGDRLVQLANKAVEVIAEPISRAVGESIKGGARIGGVPGTPAPVPAQPLTREQQIQQLQQLQARAKAAQEELERQGQGQPTT